MENLEKKHKIIIAVIVISIILGIVFFVAGRDDRRKDRNKKINISGTEKQDDVVPIANNGKVSPISGLECENYNRRPLAIMTASDVSARPSAGFTDADMVIEMPVITSSITRIMQVFVCNTPQEVGSMRSSRHDYIHIAKGLDAIYAHWGGSVFAKEKLNEGVIDNLNCNNDGGKSAGQFCFRKQGMSYGVDSGYAKVSELYNGAKEFGYRTENQFEGYGHQTEVSLDKRPEGGALRIAFAGPYAVDYKYDKVTNTYLRSWGKAIDTDRNNKKQVSPKNVVVLFAKSEQIEGQYNNVQLGDPWYDVTDSGDAYYYINGQEIRGSWKKDKGNIASKLYFYNEAGKEILFVPGQIWVEILEPGQRLQWTPFSGISTSESTTETLEK